MRALTLSLLLLLVACDGEQAPPEPPDPAPTTGGEQPPPVGEQPPDAVAELRAQYEPRSRPRDLARLSEALVDCAPPADGSQEALLDWYDACRPVASMAFDGAAGEWIVLDVDWSEGGAEHFALTAASPTAERSVLSGDFSPDTVRELQVALAGLAHDPPTQLVTGGGFTEFSMNRYAPLVSLRGPLDGWQLWIETTADLDRPEHVLWLIDASDGRHEVARRAAQAGPCDGGGFYCEATGDECDAAGLRAEGRLCVLPLGIDAVAVGPDGTLALQGTIQVAGHGGYPPFHWVAPLPAAAR